jgi:predicted phosphodiesterase
MKLAVLSDIHGNLGALEAVLSDLESVGGADELWILGDLALIGARPLECVRRVRGLIDAAKPAEDGTPPSMRVRAISGNTDRYLVNGSGAIMREPAKDAEAFAKAVAQYRFFSEIIGWTLSTFSFEDYDFLAKLPSEVGVDAPHYGYVIGYHAVPGDDEGMLLPDTPDSEAADHFLDREGRMGIGGHIHHSMDRRLAIGGWRVVNDGSVGLSFEKPGWAQWALIVFDGGDAHVDLRSLPYDIDAEVAAAKANGHPHPEVLEARLRQGR